MSPTSTLAPTVTTWKIDPQHSDVEFAVRHLMISTVKGHFSDVKGVVTLEENNPSAATIEVTIGVASINTRQEQRDAHLRSPDFFDAEKFPTLAFSSRKIVGNPLEGDAIIKGDLTIRGVTREVTLNVSSEGRGKDPWGNERAGFSARTKIDRKDFGLTWNQALETGGVVVSDEVKIAIETELVREAD